MCIRDSLRSGWSSKSICELFIAGKFEPLIDRKGQVTTFHITRSGALFNRKIRNENQSHVLSVLHNMGSVQESSAELQELGVSFDYPKPRRLIEYLLKMATTEGDLILDSFAGSGTTAHAVLNLNRDSDQKRKFILIEMDPKTAIEVTSARLKRVVQGYLKDANVGQPITGSEDGFRYCQLGSPLFDEFGDVAIQVTFSDLAAHIFFSETGTPIPRKATTEFLGTFKERAVYLLFDEASPETPREANGNVLTPDRLNALPPMPKGFRGNRVVYAEGCTVSKDRLKAAGVSFKQIPYQIDGV